MKIMFTEVELGEFWNHGGRRRRSWCLELIAVVGSAGSVGSDDGDGDGDDGVVEPVVAPLVAAVEEGEGPRELSGEVGLVFAKNGGIFPLLGPFLLLLVFRSFFLSVGLVYPILLIKLTPSLLSWPGNTMPLSARLDRVAV